MAELLFRSPLPTKIFFSVSRVDLPKEMLYERCFILLSLVLLILFKGVELEDIDGGYTEWSEWSRCDANCDGTGGHQYQSRTCTNPKPEGNGKTCEEQGLGPTYRSKECSLRPLGCGREWVALIFGLAGGIFVICVPVACYFIGSRPGKPRLTTPTSPVSREPIEEEHLVPYYLEACGQHFHSSPSQCPDSNSKVLQIVNQQNPSHQQAPEGISVPIRRERQALTENPLKVLMVELPPLHSGEQPPPPYSRSGKDISLRTYPRELPSPPYSEEEEDRSPPYIRGQPSSPYAVTSLV